MLPPGAEVAAKVRRRRLMGEINVVPYIDVMLVLLIIFMVTAPLLTQGVQVELPDADAKPIDPEMLKDREPLVLSVDRDGRYYLNVGGDEDSPVGEAEVARRAGAVLAGEPATPVLVKADERVPYGSVVRGMVLLQQAGATKIGFLTDPKAVRALEELERRR
jgi:biopolymer transport protein TolR